MYNNYLKVQMKQQNWSITTELSWLKIFSALHVRVYQYNNRLIAKKKGNGLDS